MRNGISREKFDKRFFTGIRFVDSGGPDFFQGAPGGVYFKVFRGKAEGFYTRSIMTGKDFCVTIRKRENKSGSGGNGSGRGKSMFTVIRSSYIHLENLVKVRRDHKEEWGFGFVYSDKNELERNTVGKDVGLF